MNSKLYYQVFFFSSSQQINTNDQQIFFIHVRRFTAFNESSKFLFENADPDSYRDRLAVSIKA